MQTNKQGKFLEIKNLIHKFIDMDDEGNIVSEKCAVSNVSLDVQKGEFIAVLGHNGSGKSTLAKHINAILTPTSGTLYVKGMDTREEENLWDIRQSAGMVFQNPDNQMIASVVEEDVGFGPENLGVPTEEIWKRVEQALSSVGMLSFRHHSPSRLSGGQKQRVAIAGILAMKPDCIVLDEPTAMLDPNGRKEVMDALMELNRAEKVTIILITHHMDEAIKADKVFVMNKGRLELSGTPKEVFARADVIEAAGLDMPVAANLSRMLKEYGIVFSDVLTREEFAGQVLGLWGKRGCRGSGENLSSQRREEEEKAEQRREEKGKAVGKEEQRKEEEGKAEQKKVECEKGRIERLGGEGQKLMSLVNVNFIYSPNSVYEKHALRDINLDIYEGEFIGIVGHTGSGKSTLVQHLNGLNKASSGKIYYRGRDIYEKEYPLWELRRKVGMVFQYPEHQLFESTVLKDVCFGPLNLKYGKAEAEAFAKEALRMTGLGEEYYEMSPFELSGGQKRRAAIAGVLAMKPEMLILDEPTAALDPRGRDEIYDILKSLHRQQNITIIVVSHSMEDMAKYAERMIVMEDGCKVMDDLPENIFSEHERLERMGLALPEVTYIMKMLKERGIPVNDKIIGEKQAAKEIGDLFRREGIC